jgi:F-type H+-transporting ATPase subunit a
MAVLTLLAIYIRHNLKKRPGRLQVFVEWYVDFIYNTFENTMGKHNLRFAPYFGSLFLFLCVGNALGLLGLRPITADLNTTAGCAAITFFCIHFFSIKGKGFGGYIKHMSDPIPIMLPINAIGELAFPISLCLRLFGNITGGAIIVALCMSALGGISAGWNLPLDMPIFAIGLPIIANLFFDVFEPVLQAFIFFTLSITFVGINTQPAHAEH